MARIGESIDVPERTLTIGVIFTGIALLFLVSAVSYFVYELINPIAQAEQSAGKAVGSLFGALAAIFDLIAAPFRWLYSKFASNTGGSSTGITVQGAPAVLSNPSTPMDQVPLPGTAQWVDYNNIGPAALDNSNAPVCPVGYFPQMDSNGVYVCVPSDTPSQSRLAVPLTV